MNEILRPLRRLYARRLPPLACMLVIGVMVFVLAGCGGQAAPSEGAAGAQEGAANNAAPAGAAVVRIGQGGAPDSLNPGVAVLAEAYTLFELVYDSMFQLQLDGSYTPELAESYTVSDDGKVWTFKIRDGVKFHDGTPLTAADIAFSYTLYKDHADFPFLNTYTGFFDTIEAPDAWRNTPACPWRRHHRRPAAHQHRRPLHQHRRCYRRAGDRCPQGSRACAPD